MTLPALELFPRCVLPGCNNPTTEQGHPCTDCAVAFTGYLHTAATRPLTQAEQEDRDQHIRAAQRANQTLATVASTEPLTRQNQRCWLCDQRRTCTRITGQWECRTCQTNSGQ